PLSANRSRRSGGAEEDPTPEPLTATETLSQLSYGPTDGRARIVSAKIGLARDSSPPRASRTVRPISDGPSLAGWQPPRPWGQRLRSTRLRVYALSTDTITSREWREARCSQR